ncbi:Os07g0543300 [Oryza sativa Japonica Group]|uniref:Os07g0543300 protein n=1 Tax=Oryza sativa subsp. japonica TaxID=39947 RepID=C7J4V4_ORYSJ|nr:Os07g0543300 [Oryza sativa Japonica Group]|eukprot:NP_001175244.1 Os07g0543300 [Oryza sativa Japonica Group]
MEERLVIHSKGEVLDVPRPTTVGVEDVGVARADIPHPLRDRDVDDVADVTTALVERHDGLQLQPGLLHQPEQLLVGLPVVGPGALPLHQPPPHVHHDAIDAGLRQLLQLCPGLIDLLELVVHSHHIQLHISQQNSGQCTTNSLFLSLLQKVCAYVNVNVASAVTKI